MNQQAMEQALGKLIIDGEFRDAFFSDPTVASEAAGSSHSDRERKALTRIRPGALAAFQRYLDAKRVGDWRWRQAQDVADPHDTSLRRRES
jgi:hypothetical protein